MNTANDPAAIAVYIDVRKEEDGKRWGWHLFLSADEYACASVMRFKRKRDAIRDALRVAKAIGCPIMGGPS